MQQLRWPLESAEDHARTLHPAGLGKVTLAVRQGNRWHQSYHQVDDLPQIVRMVSGQADVYLSQNRFWGRRRIANLAQLDALFADLDYYAVPDLANRPPWHVVEMALLALELERIPRPSFAVATGRGVALVWLHTPVPRASLPRWNSCQRRIYEALRHLGADAKARDAARVLRLIGTTNSRTGALVEALTPAAEPYPFEELADEVLPITRAELYDLRIRRAAKHRESGQVRPPQGFTQATLWEARLSDLQRLLQLRWFGHLPPGQRDNWLFLAGVAMSWLAIPLVMQRELYALAHQVGGWDEAEAGNRLRSVLARAHAAGRGETVDWLGQSMDPRYRFRTETILEWLEITPEEQRQLQTLIGPDVARERDRQRWHQRREAAGGVERATYLEQAEERRQAAHTLREQGKSLREIAKLLGASPEGVRRMLNR